MMAFQPGDYYVLNAGKKSEVTFLIEDASVFPDVKCFTFREERPSPLAFSKSTLTKRSYYRLWLSDRIKENGITQPTGNIFDGKTEIVWLGEDDYGVTDIIPSYQNFVKNGDENDWDDHVSTVFGWIENNDGRPIFKKPHNKRVKEVTMTTYPHNMEEIRHAEINDKGMMKCSKCPFGEMIHNMVGAYKCTNGIMEEGNYTYYGGCSLINNVKYGIATLYTTSDILVPTRVKPSAPKEIKVTTAKTGHDFVPGDYYKFDDGYTFIVGEETSQIIFHTLFHNVHKGVQGFYLKEAIWQLTWRNKDAPDGNIFDGNTRLKDDKASWKIESKSYFSCLPGNMGWTDYKKDIFKLIANEGYTLVL